MISVRFEDAGVPRLGVVRGEAIVSLAGLSGEYPMMLSVVLGGVTALERIGTYAGTAEPTLALADAHLLAPIERPGKYLAIGMNYRKHLAEAERLGVPAPKQQLWFNKQTSCLSGPYDDIDPGVTEKLDYEVELGVVIGAPEEWVCSCPSLIRPGNVVRCEVDGAGANKVAARMA